MTDPELITALCLRIGMIMEDVCGEAVMARADDEGQLNTTVIKLLLAGERISVLANAASALNAGNGS